MPDVYKVAEILIAHALRAHGDAIGIVATYGSYGRGEASPTSDLDIYYIPDDGQAASLSSQFVLDGLPYDFWGPPWAFLEAIVNGTSRRPWAVAASLIADARVLYSRSQEDLDRFHALQDRIESLTKPENYGVMVMRALDAFQSTLYWWGQMRLAELEQDGVGLSWAGRQLVHSAVNCLALVNQTYFSRGWGSNRAQIRSLPQRPADLEQLMDSMLAPSSSAGMLQASERLVLGVRRILRRAQAATAEVSSAEIEFRDFYYYVFEYRNKVLAACREGDVLRAASAACHMQEQICQIMSKVDQGFYGSEFNLLGEYDDGYFRAGFPDLLEPASRGDLDALSKRVQELDEQVREWFSEHSISLNMVQSRQELSEFLGSRDPVF